MADHVIERCSLCPRLCRSSCPVATATGREAAAPTQIADVLLAWSRGLVSEAMAREAATLCVDCGACEEHCHLGTPLPAALRAARARLLPAPEVTPLVPIEGAGTWVAIESDGRRWAGALARRLGAPVARWWTRDALGVALLGRPAWQERGEHLAAALQGRQAVTADGEVARALRGAGVDWRWLHELLGYTDLREGCAQGQGGRAGCCGGAEPLRSSHPADAARLAARWSLSGCAGVADVVCSRALRDVDRAVEDVVDRLLSEQAGEVG